MNPSDYLRHPFISEHSSAHVLIKLCLCENQKSLESSLPPKCLIMRSPHRRPLKHTHLTH